MNELSRAETRRKEYLKSQSSKQEGKVKRLVVLNDGETFTNIEGCMIVEVPDDWDEDDVRPALADGTASEVYSFLAD